MHDYIFFNNFLTTHMMVYMWNMQKIGLAVGLFTCVQNKVPVQN